MSNAWVTDPMPIRLTLAIPLAFGVPTVNELP